MSLLEIKNAQRGHRPNDLRPQRAVDEALQRQGDHHRCALQASAVDALGGQPW